MLNSFDVLNAFDANIWVDYIVWHVLASISVEKNVYDVKKI